MHAPGARVLCLLWARSLGWIVRCAKGLVKAVRKAGFPSYGWCNPSEGWFPPCVPFKFQ